MDNGTSTSCDHPSNFTMDDLKTMKEALETIVFPEGNDDDVIIYVRGACYTGKLAEGPLGQILKGKTPKGDNRMYRTALKVKVSNRIVFLTRV